MLVVGDEEMDLYLGQDKLPQEESSKYHGIPFTRNGADWKKVVLDATKKANGVIMQLMKLDLNCQMWDPSSSIKVFKLFIRPLWNMHSRQLLSAREDWTQFRELSLCLYESFLQCLGIHQKRL